jgi:surface antigen
MKHMKILTSLATFTSLILLMGWIQPVEAASGWTWMRGSALSEFTDVDWETFKTQAAIALTDNADGEQLNWTNPDTGSSGSIKPLSTFEFNAMNCRRAAFRNVTRKGVKGGGVYNLCQLATGEWMFVTDSEIDAAASIQAQP